MKKLLHLATALSLLLCVAPLQAQVKSIQIGGSNFSKLGTPNVPKQNTFFFESFYTPDILESNGLIVGDVIKKIKLPYAVPADKNFENYDINMWFGTTTRTGIPSKTTKYTADDVAELQHLAEDTWFEEGGTKTAPSFFEYTLNPPITYTGENFRFVMTGNCMNTNDLPDNNDYSSEGMAWLFSAETSTYSTAKYQHWYSYPSYLELWASGNYKFDTSNKYVLSIVLEVEDLSGVEEITAQEAKVFAANGQLYVEAASTIQSVKVYNANGALCLLATPADEQATLDASNLKGIYVVEVQTADAVKLAKVQL